MLSIKLFAVEKLFIAFAQVHWMQKSYLIPSKLLIKCWANFHENMSVKSSAIQQNFRRETNSDLMQSQNKHLFTKGLQASNWFAEKRLTIALQKYTAIIN